MSKSLLRHETNLTGNRERFRWMKNKLDVPMISLLGTGFRYGYKLYNIQLSYTVTSDTDYTLAYFVSKSVL